MAGLALGAAVALGALAACGSESGGGSRSSAPSVASSTMPTTTPSASAAPWAHMTWPGGVRPATPATLVGTWRAVRPADAAQFASTVTLTVEAGGRWTSSDGCRQRSGTWTLGADGALEVTATGSAATGCVTDAISGGIGPWTSAARAGFDGHALVLLTDDGQEIGRLVQLPPSHLMSHGPSPQR